MPSREQLQQAREGHADAIAALLNTALASRNMTAQVQRCGDELQILLESSSLPPQQATVEFVRQGLQRLKVTSIATVTLMGQKQGYLKEHWQVIFDLYGTTVTSLNEAKPAKSVAPDPQSAPPTGRNFPRADLWDSPQTVEAQSPLPPPENARPHHQDISPIGNISPMQTIPPPPPSSTAPQSSPQDENLLQLLGLGFGLGCVITYLKVTAFLLHPMITLVHELGHAFAAWLLGYPAIPAFDFVHGGGVTAHFSRAPLLIYLVYIGLAFLYYRYRKNYLTLRLLLGVTVTYSIMTFLPAHEDLITAMGHAFELLFVVIFGFQGLTGIGCRYGKLERSLYFMVAFYIWFSCLNFSWKLIADPAFQASYLSGKGGLVNDFVILAGHYAGGNLGAIAIAFLLACLAVPPITWLIYRHRHRLAAAIHRFWVVTDAPRFSW
ncbi:MAG: hypothetical protein AAFW84_08325 [Cyanobacteria bacterium J06635_15]